MNVEKNTDLTVLIVEDDPHVLLGCQQALALEDIPSVGVGSAEEALTRVGENFAGIVISDIRLPGIDGLELLTRLKALDKSLPVVLITGHGDISMAVGAMRNGAYDFMEQPFSPPRLVAVPRRALEQRGPASEVGSLRPPLADRASLEGRTTARPPPLQNLREPHPTPAAPAPTARAAPIPACPCPGTSEAAQPAPRLSFRSHSSDSPCAVNPTCIKSLVPVLLGRMSSPTIR